MHIPQQQSLFSESDSFSPVQAWLECSGSLSDKLESMTGELDIKLVNQAWKEADWWDKRFLNIQCRNVFCREIIMKQAGEAYWYARSIIPKNCYDINPNFFNRLEKESIRNLIFGEKKVTRLSMRCYAVGPFNLEYHWVKKCIKSIEYPIWARLAEYLFQDRGRFYLIEILFPQLASLS